MFHPNAVPRNVVHLFVAKDMWVLFGDAPACTVADPFEDPSRFPAIVDGYSVIGCVLDDSVLAARLASSVAFVDMHHAMARYLYSAPPNIAKYHISPAVCIPSV